MPIQLLEQSAKVCMHMCASAGHAFAPLFPNTAPLPDRLQLAAETARADAAAAAAMDEERVWHETLLQTEEDLDQQAECHGARLAATQLEASEVRRSFCNIPTLKCTCSMLCVVWLIRFTECD